MIQTPASEAPASLEQALALLPPEVLERLRRHAEDAAELATVLEVAIIREVDRRDAAFPVGSPDGLDEELLGDALTRIANEEPGTERVVHGSRLVRLLELPAASIRAEAARALGVTDRKLAMDVLPLAAEREPNRFAKAIILSVVSSLKLG